MAAKTDPVLAALKKATKGLQFISETESDLTPFVWDATGPITPEAVLKNSDYEYEKGQKVATMTLDRFFRAVPPEDKEKFDDLAAALKELLTDITVVKVGESEKDVYVVGKAPDGRWAGFMTTVVET